VGQKRFPIVTVKNQYVGISRGLRIECTCLAAREAAIHAEAEKSANTYALRGRHRDPMNAP
jgi:hypothetical protein